jgi:hypothetical protein
VRQPVPCREDAAVGNLPGMPEQEEGAEEEAAPKKRLRRRRLARRPTQGAVAVLDGPVSCSYSKRIGDAPPPPTAETHGPVVMLATPADAEIILRLYELRTEALMREARAWMTGEFWPATRRSSSPWRRTPPPAQCAFAPGDYLLGDGGGDGAARGGFRRAVCGLQRRGILSAGQVSPILEGIRERNPGFLTKTSELITRFSAAAQRYEVALKNMQARRKQPSPTTGGGK